jgi:peptidoglycan/xylan/chitin deacetylase (PgdA/CDA1 family)
VLPHRTPQSHTVVDGPAPVMSQTRLRIALYHHISDRRSDFYDDLLVTLAAAEFERQIRYFQLNYDIIGLDEVLSGNLPRRPLLITFDDAYRSVFEVAGPILSSLRLPALFLVSSGNVDGKMLMNDHILCYLSKTIGLAQLETSLTGRPPVCRSVRDLISSVVASFDYARQAGLAAELTERNAIKADVLDDLRKLYISQDQISRLAALGIEVGSHSLSHVFCRNLEPPDDEQEILEAQRSLESWTGRKVRSFSIPYGYPIDLTEHSRRVLLASGHAAIFTATSRRNQPGMHGPLWDRVTMKSCPSWGLFAWVELFPWLRSMRG